MQLSLLHELKTGEIPKILTNFSLQGEELLTDTDTSKSIFPVEQESLLQQSASFPSH